VATAPFIRFRCSKYTKNADYAFRVASTPFIRFRCSKYTTDVDYVFRVANTSFIKFSCSKYTKDADYACRVASKPSIHNRLLYMAQLSRLFATWQTAPIGDTHLSPETV